MRFPCDGLCFLLHNDLMRVAYEISCFLAVARLRDFLMRINAFWPHEIS
jgi:hypothetical protein